MQLFQDATGNIMKSVQGEDKMINKNAIPAIIILAVCGVVILLEVFFGSMLSEQQAIIYSIVKSPADEYCKNLDSYKDVDISTQECYVDCDIKFLSQNLTGEIVMGYARCNQACLNKIKINYTSAIVSGETFKCVAQECTNSYLHHDYEKYSHLPLETDGTLIKISWNEWDNDWITKVCPSPNEILYKSTNIDFEKEEYWVRYFCIPAEVICTEYSNQTSESHDIKELFK